MEELDRTIAEEMLLRRSSRTATFTLSSSSSASSSCSNLYNHQNGRTTTSTTMCSSSSSYSLISEHRTFLGSQSMLFGNQKRRPTIHDPYQLLPNLQILDDWMIVSFYVFLFLLRVIY
jgi:hypothetical protein